MDQNEYAVGQPVRVQGAFAVADEAGVMQPTDPTTTTITYRSPDGSVTALVYGVDSAVQKIADGVFYVDIDTSIAGQYWYKFRGTGACRSAGEAGFYVTATNI
jgi:hypothetical protein